MEMQLNREILVWKSIEKLTEVINNPNNLASVKQRAVKALGNIRHSEAVPVLLKVLNEDEDNSLTIETIKALGKLPKQCIDEENSKDVEEVLIKLLGSKYTNSMYRPHIIKTLSKIGTIKAVPSLIKALNKGDNLSRKYADEALDKLSNQCVDEENSEDVEEVLIKLLSNKYTNSMYRPHIIKALGKIGTIKAVPSLIKALNRGDNLSRKYAAEALGNIGSQKAIPALLKAVSHIDMGVSRASAKALGKLNSSEFKERLLKDINRDDEYVQARAIDYLGYYNKQEDIHNDIVVLIQALSHKSWIVRLATIKTLGKYIPGMDIDLLRVLHNVLFVAINDPCSAVQKAAIDIIERESILLLTINVQRCN